MSTTSPTNEATNAEQATLWNGVAGHAWVEGQALLEQMFEPFTALLVDAVRETGALRVLDVGCGTGGTTRAVARLVGSQGCCVGIDISAPMIAAARDLAGSASPALGFIQGDAQTHALAPDSFDAIISRFGVMFFDDCVGAFANLRAAVRNGGALRFIAWRSAAENPFMTAAERAAAPFLPNLPPRQPDAPGQFAFADPAKVCRILEQSGWPAPELRPVDVVCSLPAAALDLYVTRLGPVGRVLQEVDEATRQRIVAVVRAAFEPYIDGATVRFTAACWLVAARSSAVPC